MKRLALYFILIALVTGCGKGFKLTPLGVNDGSSNGPGPDDGSGGGGGVFETPDTRLRLGTREFVSTALLEIFGATVGPEVSARVSTQTTHFGGPCDLYLPGDCDQPSESQMPLIPSNASTRGALTTRVCDQIAIDDAAITYAARLAGAGAALALPSETNVASAFDLFYPGRAATQDVIMSLYEVGTTARDQGLAPLESWRFLLLTLCLAPGWQIP